MSAVDPSLVEIAEDTWRLQGRVGERNVYQYLLASPDRDELLLIDTGTSATPREVVIPALRRLGLPEEALRLVVVTHPDVDHQGGLAALREVCENAAAACGFADRAMVGDPEKLLADRYECYLAEHGLGMAAEEIRWVRANYGAPVEIDVTFSGGETLPLGSRRLQVLAAPGHSAGHLVLFEPRTGLLFSSDAVHWHACPAADGSPALCPTYEEVDPYLGTIDLIESLAPSEMHSGHWPMRSGARGARIPRRQPRLRRAGSTASCARGWPSPRRWRSCARRFRTRPGRGTPGRRCCASRSPATCAGWSRPGRGGDGRRARPRAALPAYARRPRPPPGEQRTWSRPTDLIVPYLERYSRNGTGEPRSDAARCSPEIT